MLTAVSGRYVNTVTYTYDEGGRKETETLTISGQTYTTTIGYNEVGQVASYTYPDSSTVARTYTDRGQLHLIKSGSTTIDTRSYDNGGRMTGSSYNNGVSETRAYNNDNTLASISYTGASIGNLTYGWDDNKNKTSEGIAGTMSNYGFSVGGSGYDDEDRLVNWNRTSGLNQSWDLSLVGDWDAITENGSTQNRTHGAAHELATAAGASATHDVKGNMTVIPAVLRSGSDPLAMTWDFDNRLVSADVDDDSTADVTYKFDALGRRVLRDDGTTSIVFVQSGQQTVGDYVEGTNTARYHYIYGSYIDEPVMRSGSGGLRYYHRNQQYSVTALTNGSGGIVERYAYSAYGEPVFLNAGGTVQTSSASNNRYTYTGREWDEELELYHYRARMYDPASGRFCSRDPIGFKGSQWNFYEYVGSEPLVGIDPSGEVRIPCTAQARTVARTWCAGYGGIKRGPFCYKDVVFPKILYWGRIDVYCKEHDCDYGRFIDIQTRTHGYCDYPRSCDSIKCPCEPEDKRPKCKDIVVRIRRGKGCVKARKQMRDECYINREDRPHRIARENAENALRNCKRKAASCRCGIKENWPELL